MQRLGEFFVEKGLISSQTLETEVAIDRDEYALMGNVLLSQGRVTEDELLEHLEDLYSVPSVRVDPNEVDPQLVRLLPESLSRPRFVLPIDLNEDELHVAMVRPDDLATISEVELLTGYRVVPKVSLKESILVALDRCYDESMVAAQTLADMKMQQLRSGSTGDAASATQELKASMGADDVPIVRLVNSIFSSGIAQGASDIHLEPLASKLRVRYRIDGRMVEGMTVPKHVEQAAISRIKVMTELDITERRRPQDGHLTIAGNEGDHELRISIMPTTYGEKIVARVMDREGQQLGLNSMGLEDSELKRLREAISHPYGMILVTGPTGSGKSTTLYGTLTELNDGNTNIVTVEDPVEKRIEGVNQVPVNNDFGMGFPTALKYILRQDPDIIMVGEIRDGETAQLAIQAAQTGHLLLSTMHTNSAVGAVQRLQDLDAEPFQISSSLLAIMAQRLVRVLCNYCKEEYQPNPTVLNKLRENIPSAPMAPFYHGRGCDRCNETGFAGRTLVMELMLASPAICEGINNRMSAKALQDLAISEGMRTLAYAGFQLALKGKTTLEEICQRIT